MLILEALPASRISEEFYGSIWYYFQNNIITMNDLLTDILLLDSSPGRDEILVENESNGYRVGLGSRYEMLIHSDTRQPPDQRVSKLRHAILPPSFKACLAHFYPDIFLLPTLDP